MSDATWTSQLAEAISALSDVSQLVAFPSRCDTALAVASKQGLSEESRVQLKQLLSPVAKWRASPPPEFAAAFAQLRELCALGPPSLSDGVIGSLLHVFPKYTNQESQWLDLAFDTQRLALVAELFSLGFIAEGDVNRRAEEDPVAFCVSRVPEILPPASKVWQAARVLDGFCERAATATSREETARFVRGIIHCYAANSSRKAEARIAEFVSASPAVVAAKFLDEVFRRPREAMRLVTYLRELLHDKKARPKRDMSAVTCPHE